MKAAFHLSLANLSSRHPFHEHRRRLVINGEQSATVIFGDEIDGVYRFGSLHLLITRYDYYDGVSHWFSVLDQQGKILDMASTPDYFGFIEWIEQPSQDSLRFGFFGTNDIWQVRICTEGEWSFKLSDLARRWNRYFSSKRHLFFSCEQRAA
jgi:hypothetical protein